ncbi:MAG TPA: hypothetical protein VGQ42_03540 [Candidatus Dormibacteraeota bacterium]|jgi:hypothetical protein|nr:hypothetical protein [Candidatus Dormibacteraeota bacterium]
MTGFLWLGLHAETPIPPPRPGDPPTIPGTKPPRLPDEPELPLPERPRTEPDPLPPPEPVPSPVPTMSVPTADRT